MYRYINMNYKIFTQAGRHNHLKPSSPNRTPLDNKNIWFYHSTTFKRQYKNRKKYKVHCD